MTAIYVTGHVGAAGGTIPNQSALPPAPGRLGLVTILNDSASVNATLTSNSTNAGGFILPFGVSKPVRWVLDGNYVTVSAGAGVSVSFGYAAATP